MIIITFSLLFYWLFADADWYFFFFIDYFIIISLRHFTLIITLASLFHYCCFIIINIFIDIDIIDHYFIIIYFIEPLIIIIITLIISLLTLLIINIIDTFTYWLITSLITSFHAIDWITSFHSPLITLSLRYYAIISHFLSPFSLFRHYASFISFSHYWLLLLLDTPFRLSFITPHY
jgi:hypothetical protein